MDNRETSVLLNQTKFLA